MVRGRWVSRGVAARDAGDGYRALILRVLVHPYVLSQVALRSEGAEASEIVRARHLTNVFLRTVRTWHVSVRKIGRTKFAKPTLVSLTSTSLNTGVNMDIEAFICRVAEPKRSVKAALWHAPQIVFVQVVTLVALFA